MLYFILFILSCNQKFDRMYFMIYGAKRIKQQLQYLSCNQTEMDRDIRVFNRPIIDKIQRKNQQMHLKRLKSIKSGGSNRTMPLKVQPPQHYISNKKAALMEEFKKTEIEKQNVLLFNKMMRIMKRPDPHNQTRNLQSRNNRTVVENSRIIEQNKCMFERLENQKPTISNKKLEEERRKNLTILRFLGKYPNPSASRTFHDSQSVHAQAGGRLTDTRKRNNPKNIYGREEYDEEHEMDEEMYEEEMAAYQEQMRQLKKKQLADRTRGSLNYTSENRRRFMSQAVNRRKMMDSQGSEQGMGKLDSLQINPNVTSGKNFLDSRTKGKTSSSYHQNPLNPQHNQQKPQFGKKNPMKVNQTPQILLYQCKIEIEGLTASVHFYRLYHNYLIKATFQSPVHNQLSHSLEIPQGEGNQFFSLHNYNYPKIAKMLIMEEGCLVIHPEAAENYQEKSKRVSTQQKLPVLKSVENPNQVRVDLKYEEDLEEYID